MAESNPVVKYDIEEFLFSVSHRLERIEELLLASGPSDRFQKEWYSIPEAAKLLGKQPFTVREWCRLSRIHAKKRKCGRGKTSEWVISRTEIERYLNEGLLPQRF